MIISRSQYFYDDETFSRKQLPSCHHRQSDAETRVERLDQSERLRPIRSHQIRFLRRPNHSPRPTRISPGRRAGCHQRPRSRDRLRFAFHTYPISETIHIGNGGSPLVFQAAYDEGFGTVSTSTDFNTNTTTTAMIPSGDSRGRHQTG